jgi:hypothetical protein
LALNKTRAELEAEVIELHKIQIESNRQAMFGGWTRKAEDEHHRRADRLAALYRQLAALTGEE